MREPWRTFNNMGTVFYMAPERFRQGFRSSRASDVFSLGMIYLELLTGTKPFRESVHPVESLLTGGYFRDAETLMSQSALPQSIRRLILSMLAPNPSDRPQDYKTLRTLMIKAYSTTIGFLAKIFG